MKSGVKMVMNMTVLTDGVLWEGDNDGNSTHG